MEAQEKKLQNVIREFYPKFQEQVVKDFAHLLAGNIKQVKKSYDAKANKPPVDVNHQEQVVCLGTGFDWLHLPNFALIVNPVALDPVDPFVTQLKVLRGNWESKRIPHEDGMLVMVSTSFHNVAHARHARLKAISLADFAQDIIEKQFPDLVEAGLQMIVGTMNEATRLFMPVDEKVFKEFSKSNYVAPKELNKIGKFVLEHNKAQYDEFISPYNIRQRELYHEDHPTQIMALKCMDGRIHLPIATAMPMGVIQPMRNVGAKFNFGWKAFFDRVAEWVEEAREAKPRRNCLILSTYHFSKSNPHLGCAGHGYDTEAAKKNAEELVKQARYVFGEGENFDVSVATIGYNTDHDSIILHGDSPDQVFDIEDMVKELLHPELN